MATYTDNYNLKKPTYAEPANVKDINENMDMVDDIMHSSQVSLADAYDLNSTYNTGDKVMYEMLMYKCKEDGVTGAWDASKWERTTAVEGSGGADLDIYGEASGTAEASFSDGAEASLVECEIGIVPTQDLHGYSKPWAGGAGKNKCDTSNMSTATVSGVTFDRADDGIITVGGEATAAVYKQLVNFQTENGVSYILSGCPEGGSSSKYRLTLAGYGYDYGSGLNFTGDGNSHALLLDVFTGYPTEPLEFKPMIRESGTSDAYEPYSNICPISGHTDVTVTVASTSGGSGEDTTVALDRTVYGGTLDVTTGELIVTHGMVDLGTLNFTKTTQYGYTYFTGSPITNKKFNSICSEYDAVKKARNALSNGEIGTHNTTNSFEPCIRDDTKADLTDEQFKTAMGGVMLVYELATPQTFNLTPTQVKTLLGQNYVSHDGGGTISLVYIKKDSTIIPNPAGAEIPLTGLEIDGEKFKIVPETEDISEMEWTLLDSTTSTGTSTLIPEGTKYLALVVDFSVSASIVAIESIKNIIKTMDITSKSVWNVGYEWCDTAGNHTYVAMSGDATHVQAYSGYNTVTAKVYAVS